MSWPILLTDESDEEGGVVTDKGRAGARSHVELDGGGGISDA